MKVRSLILLTLVLLAVPRLAGAAETLRVTPLMDTDRMMTLDGEWSFRLLLGKPVLPER